MDKRIIEDLQTVSREELQAAAEMYDALLAASKPRTPFLQGFDGRRIPLDPPVVPATPVIGSGFAVVPDYSAQVTAEAEKLLKALERRVAQRCAAIVYGGRSQEAHRLAREIEREFDLSDSPAQGNTSTSASAKAAEESIPSDVVLRFWALPWIARKQIMEELGVLTLDLLRLPEAARYLGCFRALGAAGRLAEFTAKVDHHTKVQY